jgi:hypothetical protein
MEGTLRSARVSDERWLTFVPLTVLASELLLLGMAIVLCARRASGAFTSPLPAWPLVATAAGLLAWAVVVRAVARSMHARWLPTAVILLFAIACSYPATRAVDWATWLSTLLLDLWSQSKLAGAQLRPVHSAQIELNTELQIQQLTRFRTADGSETIRGIMVAEFAAGERSTEVYAAFCPPFEHLPKVEAQVADDSQAKVKITQHLHNGVQFEVRLPHAAASRQNVTIEFFASNTLATV